MRGKGSNRIKAPTPSMDSRILILLEQILEQQKAIQAVEQQLRA
jgi:hypothetical protein